MESRRSRLSPSYRKLYFYGEGSIDGSSVSYVHRRAACATLKILICLKSSTDIPVCVFSFSPGTPISALAYCIGFPKSRAGASSLSDLQMGVNAGDLACSSACLRVLHGFELP
jgi:hypothetical protein